MSKIMLRLLPLISCGYKTQYIFRKICFVNYLYPNVINFIGNCDKFTLNFHTSIKMDSLSNNHIPRELLVPVPYGFIAAKAWGSEEGIPVLALHGWQDNAGSFDKLIPLLSPSLYIIAIDAPGHGLSSHKPKGSIYHYMEMLIDIRRVVKFLKWEKFSIIGHSLGGTVALMYASVYLESVLNVVVLDIVKPASRKPEVLPKITREGIESILYTESKLSDSPPVYTPEEAHKRLMTATFGEITSESASVLLKRGTKLSSCGKGLVFTRDLRLKNTEELQKFSHDALKGYMKNLKCNLLIIYAKGSKIYMSRTPEVIQDFIDIYKKHCQSFQTIEVEGRHFVHLDEPEKVAPHINLFFNMHCEIKAKV